MKKYFVRIVSILLMTLTLMQSFPIIPVYANSTANSFIDFYANSNGAVLEAKNLSNQDYYALHVYMSNWFKPGDTTLQDLIDCDSEFFDDFATSVGLQSNDQLKSVVKTFGEDVYKGIQTGSCTIVNGSNNIVNGEKFLQSILDTLGSDTYTTGKDVYNKFKGFKSSKLYWQNKNNLAFDFSSPAVHAAFQTVMAYSPDLFLMSYGLKSVKMFFLDATGNLWAAKGNAIDSDYEGNSYDKGKNALNRNHLDEVYLILPACLNPSVFSPTISNQKDLRMPLMNRFVLSSIMQKDSATKGSEVTFEKEYIPIYNVLSYADSEVLKTSLRVIGLHTLSPFTLETDGIRKPNFWSEDARKESMANFLYNHDAFVVSPSSSAGKSFYETNSYIVFSVSLNGIKTLNNEDTADGVIDMKHASGFLGLGSGNPAFDVYGKDDTGLDKQKKLLMYFLNPTKLSLNQVSMNFYDLNLEPGNASVKDEVITKLAGSSEENVSSTTLASAKLTELGLSGMSLFLTDAQISFTDSEIENEFYAVAPENMIHSRFVSELISDLGANRRNLSDFKNIIADGLSDSVVLNYLFKNTGEDKLYEVPLVQDLFDKELSNVDLMRLGDKSAGDSVSLYPSNTTFKDGMNFACYNAAWYESDPYDTSYIGASVDSAEGYKDYTSIFFLMPHTKSIINIGNANEDITYGRLLSLHDTRAVWIISTWTNQIEDVDVFTKPYMHLSASEINEYILAYYGYSLFFPSTLFESLGSGSKESISVLGKEDATNKKSNIKMANFPDKYMMGVYLGYLVDMMGLGTCVAGESLGFGLYSSPFLPKYNITSSGANLSLETMVGVSGIDKSEDLSFEEMQKDLIRRIYGLTSDNDDSYRNSMIKNILEGVILTIHRTITGTWYSNVSSISVGDSSTYQSVTSYIYTPTLEELSFTATLMNNYIQIYIFCLLCVLFILILMVLLHMRSWQQGILTFLAMSVALLFPYVLISNTINISNKISNEIYSDRFDFWAMSEHYQSIVTLQGSDFMDEKDKWLAEGNATTDVTKYGGSGVKIKWMSPKKVDMFQNLYSDASLSQSFVTNIEIFKWLFASTIYDSEYVDTDVYGSYVYRSYNNIALEADSYYKWGTILEKNSTTNPPLKYSTIKYNSYTYDTLEGLNILFNDTNGSLRDYSHLFAAGIGAFDNEFYTLNYGSNLKYPIEKLNDINKVSQYIQSGKEVQAKEAEAIGTWGMYAKDLTDIFASWNIEPVESSPAPGIFSNLPSDSYTDADFTDRTNPSLISKAIYLKNTESPYYYFYSVLKKRYSETSGSDTTFKQSLLNYDIFRVSSDVSFDFTSKNISGSYRDFLDLEGLFTYVIPYLKLGNDYVADWQKLNGSEIEEYNFQYEVNESNGLVKQTTIGILDGENVTGERYVNSDYINAVNRKNAMNRIWNMYSPWVDSLYELGVYNEKVSFGGVTKYIEDSLNPSSYIQEGRPMIFSEADMLVKGYSYKDLTDIERRILSVTEKTYKDLMYLVNYYDMDDEVLLCAAAMYATFNFNTEFSDSKMLGESVMLYPQGFELKNFNYDAFMRLALLNSTGEQVFAEDDLYERILEKTSIFTGLFLILCDLFACVVIPLFKFVIILALLFLGLLMCITCVVNPPEKIMSAISKSVLLPTVLFMLLNIGFSWCISLVVGEGLTAYVGSKTVNLATNDPTITMLVMAALGVVYSLVSFKIIKMIIDSYKKFGMSSILATVGVIGSAFTATTSKLAKAGRKVVGAGAGAVVGAATAEKGERLVGAIEGGSLGSRRVINQRIRDKRYREMMKHSGGRSGSAEVTEGIDARAGGKSSDLVKKPEVKKPDVKKPDNASKTNKLDLTKAKDAVSDAGKRASELAKKTGKKLDAFANPDRGTKIESSSEVHGGYKQGKDAKMSRFDKAMAKGAAFMAHTQDFWQETKVRTVKAGLKMKDAYTDTRIAVAKGKDALVYGARNAKAAIELAPDAIKEGGRRLSKGTKRLLGDFKAGAQLAGEEIKGAPGRAKKYLKKGLDTYKQDLEYHRGTSLKDRDMRREEELSLLREKSAVKAKNADREISIRKTYRDAGSKKNRKVCKDV